MYFITWIPFLISLILAFYLLISQQIIELKLENLKTQSYQSQIYVMRYLKGLNKETGEGSSLEQMASHFAKYIATHSGYRTQIFDREGMLADSDSFPQLYFPQTKDVTSAFSKKSYSFFYQGGYRYISFSSPIKSMSDNRMGETIGVIRYLYPMQKERIFLIQVMAVVLLLSMAILMINVLLSRRNADQITESVNVLKESAIVMQNGDLSQTISIQSGDEMEELAKTFDIMRRRLKEYISRLDTQSDQIQKFYNNVAHQLKTPLTSIIGYSQLIQISDNLDNICEDAFIIEESGEKLLKSIDVMLQGAKKEGLYAPLHISQFLLYDVVEEAIQLLKPRLERLQVGTINSCLKIKVQTDREKLMEIILTLMDNALIHSECKEITFYSRYVEGQIYLHIKDDGKGIPSQDADHIFNAFYQGASAKGSGSGLGLSICDSLAKDLKSKIEFISGERGAEFAMEIPNLQL